MISVLRLLGGIPLRIFSEWWLATEKFSMIDKFILTSFHGVIFNGCNGLSMKYQVSFTANFYMLISYFFMSWNDYSSGFQTTILCGEICVAR